MSRANTTNDVIVTKVVRGYELGETLAHSAERLISAVNKSEKGVRELAMELFKIQDGKLLANTEFKGIGEFFETMTGLSSSSASQYLRTFKAFKNYDNDKWCGYSALVPFSMLTEITKLYGIVKHTETIIDDGHKVEQTGNTAECGDGLLKAFCKIVSEFDDVPNMDLSSEKKIDETVKAILLYITANWTNKQVRDAIEGSAIVTEFEKSKDKKKKTKKKDTPKTTDDNDDTNDTEDNDDTEDIDDKNYNKILEIEKLVADFAINPKLTKKAFISKFYDIYNA